MSGVILGKTGGFVTATTDSEAVINSGEINTLVVVTRRNSHAGLVREGLAAGKHVFVENPLALGSDEVQEIELRRQDNGQNACAAAFLAAVADGRPAPNPEADIFEVARVSIEIAEALRKQ